MPVGNNGDPSDEYPSYFDLDGHDQIVVTGRVRHEYSHPVTLGRWSHLKEVIVVGGIDETQGQHIGVIVLP